VVYIASYDYNLYSLNIIDGTVKWKFATTGLVKSSPVPYNGSILVASYDGYLYAVDSSQGTLQWKYNVSGNIQSSPVVDNLTGGNFVSQISGFVN
jgi:outer membrane protein assembly factor BamB